MARTDNYAIQAEQARRHFLTYDQDALLKKCPLPHDEHYLYPTLFSLPHRFCRLTGSLQRKKDGIWTDCGFNETMTFLDVFCDSKEDRSLTGRWNGMQNFGLQFHQNLLENEKDPFADRFDQNPAAFHRACKGLKGRPIPGGDMAYALELMDGLEIAVQFWHSDEDFCAQIRYFWDENALQYIRYETMYFATGWLRGLLLEQISGQSTD